MDRFYFFIGENNAFFQKACELNDQATLALLDRARGRPVSEERINNIMGDLHRAIAETAAQHSHQVTDVELAREIMFTKLNDCPIVGRNQGVLLAVLKRCWDLKELQ